MKPLGLIIELAFVLTTSAKTDARDRGVLDVGEPALSFMTVDIEHEATTPTSLTNKSVVGGVQTSQPEPLQRQHDERSASPQKMGMSTSPNSTIPGQQENSSRPLAEASSNESASQAPSIMRRQAGTPTTDSRSPNPIVNVRIVRAEAENVRSDAESITVNQNSSGGSEALLGGPKRTLGNLAMSWNLVILNIIFVVGIWLSSWYRRQQRVHVSKLRAAVDGAPRATEVMEQFLERVRMPEIKQSPWAPSPPPPRSQPWVEFRGS